MRCLQPWMPWGLGFVKVVIADGMEFPAHWVVQRVRPRVAPMAVEIVLGERGARSGQFE